MFNFMKWRWVYLVISLLVIIPGAVSLALFGLKWSIDFTGGTLLEITATGEQVTLESVTAQVQQQFQEARVTQVGLQSYQIKGPSIDNQTKNQLLGSLEAHASEVTEQRFETLGPAIGQESLLKTGVAILLSFGVILVYLARQFQQFKFGFFAILAMIHDSLLLLGSFSLLGHLWNVEVSLLFVTAFLTTLSFSVHDTIVVYDRIRELRKVHPKDTSLTITNGAIWQTITRSLNNSITVILMLLALVLLGGESIKWFALALLIGAITGTYSSTFVAVPLLYTWEEVQPRLSATFKKLKLSSLKSR